MSADSQQHAHSFGAPYSFTRLAARACASCAAYLALLGGEPVDEAHVGGQVPHSTQPAIPNRGSSAMQSGQATSSHASPSRALSPPRDMQMPEHDLRLRVARARGQVRRRFELCRASSFDSIAAYSSAIGSRAAMALARQSASRRAVMPSRRQPSASRRRLARAPQGDCTSRHAASLQRQSAPAHRPRSRALGGSRPERSARR